MAVVSRWMWAECMGVVVGRYIDFLIYIIYLSLLLLYLFYFAARSLLFAHFKNVFRSCSSTFCNYMLAIK